ncbi:hypothetical protein HID58_045739 [Brassica napus]|uniref:Uncharacterized protein n=1 Tax=Brassica napus TaxID=3708 RepID=A0ABQ8AUE2_BRANA|nr:hypothetical protein HID58_045739 [Brassica napus]
MERINKQNPQSIMCFSSAHRLHYLYSFTSETLSSHHEISESLESPRKSENLQIQGTRPSCSSAVSLMGLGIWLHRR